MSATGRNWWQRVLEGTIDGTVGVATSMIRVGVALAVIFIADKAPEFAAIVIAGALVALAIYKRPPTAIHQHFDLVNSDVTLQGTRVDLSTAYALKAVQEIVDAAKNLPEKQENAR